MDKPQHKMVIAPDVKPLTMDIISQMFFGMPFNEAVKSVHCNQNGQYDKLYASVHKK